MNNQFIEKHKNDFESIEAFLKKDVSTLRIGRANPSMVENILVNSYGAKTPIQHLASISSPDARSITIQPWDKNALKDIEKGIIEAQIGLNPVNEGNLIRITLPQLTQEDRVKIVKILNQKLEQAKVKIRIIRDRAREEILHAQKNNEITEDDKYDYLKELDEYTKKQNEVIENFGINKEKEIMTI